MGGRFASHPSSAAKSKACTMTDNKNAQPSHWVPGDFDVSRGTSDSLGLNRSLSRLSCLKGGRHTLTPPFVSTSLVFYLKDSVDTDNRLGYEEESPLMCSVTTSAAVGLSKGRRLLTVVGGDARRTVEGSSRPERSGPPSGVGYEPIPPIKMGLWHRLWLRFDSAYERPESLWLTEKSPEEIAEFHLQSIVSIVPKRESETEVRQKLLEGGLGCFSKEDLLLCDFLIVPSFAFAGNAEPFLSILHYPEQTEHVNAVLDTVMTECGFDIAQEWRAPGKET